MALGDYTPTAWVNGTAPAINATNLGHIETKIGELDSYMQYINPIGKIIDMYIEQATSELFPYLPLYGADQTITTAHWPLLVPLLRAQKASIVATTDFSVTVTGSNIVFPNTTPGIAACQLLINDAIVGKYINTSEIANFDNTADYTVRARTVNVAGTDYIVTGVTLGTRTVAVTGSPASGAQTASLYTYRIAGSTTTARVNKASGFVAVTAGDAAGEVVAGWSKMDRGQNYNKTIYGLNSTADSENPGNRLLAFINPATTKVYKTGVADLPMQAGCVRDAVSDPQNGTPRTGKTNDPRTIGVYKYLHGGVYVA